MEDLKHLIEANDLWSLRSIDYQLRPDKRMLGYIFYLRTKDRYRYKNILGELCLMAQFDAHIWVDADLIASGAHPALKQIIAVATKQLRDSERQ